MSDAAGIIFVIGRVVFVLNLLFAAVGFHIAKSQMAEGYARSIGFPLAAVAGWPTGLWLLAASLSIALGIWPDIGALMVIGFALPAALFFHTFWKMEGDMAQQQQQLFFRNMAMTGAALVMFALFATLGPDLRYVITDPLITF